MKVLLVLALVAIIYSWYLSRNKTYIKKCKEEYKTRQEKNHEYIIATKARKNSKKKKKTQF